MPTIYLWQISDITSSGPDVFSNTSDGNGGAVGVSTFTISSGATTHEIDVVDNDSNLENNDATSQDIASAVSFDGATFTPGDNIQAEYSYIVRPVGSSDPADNITVYALRMDNTVHGVTSDAPLVPGVEYNVLSISSNSPTVGYSNLVVCFTTGTAILTDRGERPVESLAVGSMVQTLHHGLQPIQWIGKRRVSPKELQENPSLRSIRIRRGALNGISVPAEDLIVSPQHRILVSSRIAARMFGSGEVLIAAKKLLPLHGVDVVETESFVDYWHFMCADHQVVFANGTTAETLFIGAEALKALSFESRSEIFSLFPDLSRGWRPEPASIFATGRRANQLIARHVKNRKPILPPALNVKSRLAL